LTKIGIYETTLKISKTKKPNLYFSECECFSV